MGSVVLQRMSDARFMGLLVSSNDTAYLKFVNDMTKDTTTVSFKMYNEGEDAEIPIEVSVYGQMQSSIL